VEELEPADTERDLEDDEIAQDDAEELSSCLIAIVSASHDP